MRAKRAIGLVGCLVALTAIGGVVSLRSFDMDRYRWLVAEHVRETTGRALAVRGDIDLALSLTPAIDIEDVGLENAVWGSRPEMIAVDRVEVQIALLPLLRGDIEVKRLVLRGVDLLLERNAEGRGNWELELDPVPPGATPKLPLLNDVRVEDLQLAYRDARSEQHWRLIIDELVGQAASLRTPIRLVGKGSVNHSPFRFHARLAGIAQLAGTEPYPFTLRARAGGADVALEGLIDNPRAPRRLRTRIAARGANLRTLSPVIGEELPDLGPYETSFELNGGREAWEFTDLKVSLGRTRLAGMLALRPGASPSMDAELNGSRVDLSELLGAFVDGEDPSPPSPTAEERLFSERSLPIDRLPEGDYRLALSADELIAPEVTLQGVRLDATLRDRRLKLEPLRVGFAGGVVRGAVAVDAARETPAATVNFHAEGLDVGSLVTRVTDKPLLEGEVDLAVSLQGRGRSLAAMLASANGRAAGLMGESRAEVGALDNVVGGATKLIGGLFSRRAETATVNCVATSFEVQDGIATSNVLLADTEYSTLKGDGTVDLRTESLDLVVSPDPKTTTLNVAVPVKIGGTLKSPTFSPEKFATFRKLGALVGAIFFPPAAVAALADLGSGDDNPCLRLAAGGDAATGNAEASDSGGSDDSLGGKLGGALKGLFSTASGGSSSDSRPTRPRVGPR